VRRTVIRHNASHEPIKEGFDDAVARSHACLPSLSLSRQQGDLSCLLRAEDDIGFVTNFEKARAAAECPLLLFIDHFSACLRIL